MKFDRSNKFDLCYYGQVKSLLPKSSVPSKGTSKHLALGGNIYFAGDSIIQWRDRRLIPVILQHILNIYIYTFNY